MKKASRFPVVLTVLVTLAVPAARLDAQSAGRQFGVAGGISVGGAPLGEVAESYGVRAVPGVEYAVRLFTRSARNNEWSIGVVWDRYDVGQVTGMPVASTFDYSSSALVVGRSWPQRVNGAALHLGLDAGWRRYSASSSRPNVYTGELEASTVKDDAAFFGLTYGIELAAGSMSVSPRLRLEASYPDFGGGDGYSALHSESDLGFRASVGVELKQSLLRR